MPGVGSSKSKKKRGYWRREQKPSKRQHSDRVPGEAMIRGEGFRNKKRQGKLLCGMIEK